MTNIFDVAVIGLGAMGSAALYELAGRGVRAVGIERFEPGHERGSSHGESRAIRLAYAEHPSYVPLLHRAYAKWRELEVASGATLMTITGILEAGWPGSAVVRDTVAASLEHDLVHEVLDAGEIARRFPAFRLPPDWTGVFQPQGGILRPEQAIDAFLAGARHRGADIRTSTPVTAIETCGTGVVVQTDRGAVEAARVIIATGAWIGAFAPALAPHLTLTRQVLGWFAPVEPALVGPDIFPVFILDDGDDMVYGFPDFAGTGVKAASHVKGRVLAQADDLRQDGDASDEAQIRRMLGRHLPAANGALRGIRTCLYTRTPDEFFVIDHAPNDPRVVLASPCSGHGFKFASVVGEILADLALDGTTPHDISRFRLDRLMSLPGAGEN